MGKINVAIDGPAGSGKGITSKLLAEKLDYNLLDTGAMYRAVALYFIRIGITPEEFDSRYLSDISLEFDSNNHIFLNGEDVSGVIRTPDVSILASEFSVFPQVRDFLVKQQKEIVKNKGYVAEGRDTTTVVIPNAEVKIFLTASSLIRAKRRLKDHIDKGEKISLEELAEQIKKRDEIDMAEGKIGRLYKADDAILLDNSDLSIDEAVKFIYNLVQDKISKLN